jgi:mercuric ion transport protein
MLKTGIAGFVLTALCCLTPVLVWLFAGLGLSALVGGLDYILFPLLGVFAILCVVGLKKQRQRAAAREEQQ